VTDARHVAAFAVSAAGAAGVALSASGHLPVPVPVLALLVPVVAYPVARLLLGTDDATILDPVYLACGFAALGGLLAFGAPYPVGFHDVQVHLLAMSETVVDGRIHFADTISVNFVGLYLVTTALSLATGLPTSEVARLLPLLTFPLTVLVFYHGIAAYFLPPRGALFAALAFGTNWGVYRFAMEFRTLSLALVFLLLVLALFLRGLDVDRTAPGRLGLYAVLIGGLVVTHFATYVFYLCLLAVLVVAVGLVSPRRAPARYLVLSGIAGYLYTAHVTGTLGSFVGYSSRNLLATLLASSTATESIGTGSSKGLVGLTYGPTMFYAEWTVRAAFVLSFGVFVLVWVRRRDRFSNFVALSAGAIGLMLVGTALVGFLLNPGRVMTFFAIPYGLVFGAAVVAVETLRSDRRPFRGRLAPLDRVLALLDRLVRPLAHPHVGRGVRVAFAGVLVLFLVTSTAKLPAGIVGDTDPVRGPVVVDFEPGLDIDGDELALRAYLGDHADGARLAVRDATADDSRTMTTFYERALAGPIRTVGCGCTLFVATLDAPAPGEGPYADVAPGNRVYDDGTRAVYRVTGVAFEAYPADEVRVAAPPSTPRTGPIRVPVDAGALAGPDAGESGAPLETAARTATTFPRRHP
jgi:hypothetical protein